MEITRRLSTQDDELLVRSKVIGYYLGAGYKQTAGAPALIFERGSKVGSWSAFSTRKWHSIVTVLIGRSPDGLTEVSIVYDIDTTGQWVTGGERRKWEDEINGLAAGLNSENLAASKATFTPGKTGLEAQLRSGAGWFLWIAGLSVVNTVIFHLGGSLTFVVGLGMTQFIDGVAYALREGLTADAQNVLFLISIILDLAVAGVFVLFGIFASKGKRWAFITGMALYFLDALLVLWAQDFLSIAFHLVALWGLFRGYRAARALQKTEEAVPAVPSVIQGRL